MAIVIVTNPSRPIDSCGNTVAQPNVKTCVLVKQEPPKPLSDVEKLAVSGFLVLVVVFVIVAAFIRK